MILLHVSRDRQMFWVFNTGVSTSLAQHDVLGQLASAEKHAGQLSFPCELQGYPKSVITNRKPQ